MIRHVTGRGVDWDVVSPILTNNWSIWDAWEIETVEPVTLDLIAEYAKPGTTFIDCGAHIGTMSLWASHCGATRVIAIEPDPLAAEFLRVNVAMNNANVDIFEGAISDVTGTLHIDAPAEGWGACTTRVQDVGTEVPCLTFPDLFDLYDVENVCLVKMDIEGFECVVLEHAAPFLAERGIPLWVGMHQHWWSRDVRREWFDGYGSVSGELGGVADVLALP